MNVLKPATAGNIAIANPLDLERRCDEVAQTIHAARQARLSGAEATTEALDRLNAIVAALPQLQQNLAAAGRLATVEEITQQFVAIVGSKPSEWRNFDAAGKTDLTRLANVWSKDFIGDILAAQTSIGALLIAARRLRHQVGDTDFANRQLPPLASVMAAVTDAQRTLKRAMAHIDEIEDQRSLLQAIANQRQRFLDRRQSFGREPVRTVNSSQQWEEYPNDHPPAA